jgi:hypothetical protein
MYVCIRMSVYVYVYSYIYNIPLSIKAHGRLSAAVLAFVGMYGWMHLFRKAGVSVSVSVSVSVCVYLRG